jgi:hypothetical protein
MDSGSRPTSTSSRARTPLGPVRISREASANELFATESPGLDKVQTVDASLDLKKRDPLPPIGYAPEDDKSQEMDIESTGM